MRMQKRYEECLELLADGKRLVLFGASQAGRNFIEDYKLYDEIEYFCDNDEKKRGSKLLGKEVFLPDKLVEDNESIVVVITSTYQDEIYRQLKDMGIKHVYPSACFEFRSIQTKWHLSPDWIKLPPGKTTDKLFIEPIKLMNSNKDKIEAVRSFFSEEESAVVYDEYMRKRRYCYGDCSDIIDESSQYFPKDIIAFSEDEVFVDVGCFDGKTSAEFAKIVDGRFENIYAVEVDEYCFAKCLHTLSQDKYIDGRFEFLTFGASNKSGKARITPFLSCSRISGKGSHEVELCRLDDKISGRVSFIKMDVEGEELRALEGAQGLIKAHKPKLAISIYHKVEDLWEIPLFIKQLVPEYKLYVRHHNSILNEFVLYAVV